MTLNWDEDCDTDDNAYYHAESAACDGEWHFSWQIEQVLRRNRIVWIIEGSDSELLVGTSDGDEWDTIEDAKAYVEEREAEIRSLGEPA